MRAADKGDYRALQLGETTKRKSYSALCRLSAAPTPQQLAQLNAMQVHAAGFRRFPNAPTIRPANALIRESDTR